MIECTICVKLCTLMSRNPASRFETVNTPKGGNNSLYVVSCEYQKMNI